MTKLKEILKRTLSLVALKVSGVIAAGSIGGIELWQSGLIAAFVGVMQVVEDLSRAYLSDGQLTNKEINDIFAKKADEEQ